MKYIKIYEDYTDKYGKLIVYDEGDYKIAVSDNNNPTRISVWKEDKNIGNMYNQVTKYKGEKYLKVSSIDIDKKYRGLGLGKELYRVALKYTDTKGILSYLPDRINKNTVPSIYKSLGGVIEDGDYAIIYKEGND